ncbi:MAG TPA: cytochrome c [Anaerolineae bacterium]|nr:cytochrome c [Anaerolineae bacterium]
MSGIILVALLASGLLLVAACGESDGAGNGDVATSPPATEPQAPADPTAPPDTPTTAPPTETVAPEGTTADTLAAAGEEVYADHCASCHGEQGEGGVGPALMGDRARLNVYGTADALYSYVHRAMPQNAPGSLSDEQYLQVVTLLLLENDYVQADTPVSREGLSEIELQ